MKLPHLAKQKSQNKSNDDLLELFSDSAAFDSSAQEELRNKGIYYITDFIGGDNNTWLEIHQDILLKHLSLKWHDDIQLIINSYGGYVSSGWALIDLLNWIRMDVRTIALGFCASQGACLACCGTIGKRIAAPNTSFMVHGARQGGVEGNVHELITIADSMVQEQERDMRFWLSQSKYRTKEEVTRYFLDGKDHYFTAEEAFKHGIIDGIVGQPTKKPIKNNVKPK